MKLDLNFHFVTRACESPLWETCPCLRSPFQRAVQYQVCGYDWEVRRAFGCHSHHDQVSRLYVKQPFNCQFKPFKAPPKKKCAWKGEIPTLKGQIVNICGRTEELQVVRELDYGIQQFVSQIVNEPPPYHQSLWLSSDGYFYTLSLAPADISHKNFKSGSWILKAWGCEGRKLVCHLVQ